MGRPRAFDETEVVHAAARLFATRSYDGVSVDDLVTSLGVHRNSLYKTFGSKHGLYLAALRRYVEHDLRPLLRQPSDDVLRSLASADLGLLLLALAERAPHEPDVAAEVVGVLAEIDVALGGAVVTETVLGRHLRSRTAS
jgi:AcrR family transcriptional regulator